MSRPKSWDVKTECIVALGFLEAGKGDFVGKGGSCLRVGGVNRIAK